MTIDVPPALQKLKEAYDFIESDPAMRRAYEQYEKADLDFRSGIYDAKQEGERIGRQEVAKNLKRMGIPLEQIAEGTGLSEQEILRL
jgi:predicted transposase/invertase (TIGR01784 family)